MNWKTIAQWVSIILVLTGFFLSQDRRITSVEVSMNEQMNRYREIIITFTDRLDRIEDKLDRVIENGKK